MSWLERIRADPARRFVLTLAAVLAVEVVVYPLATKHWFFAVETLTARTAWVTYGLLHLASPEAGLDGNLVLLGPFSVRIIEECTGVFEVIVFLAAVLAFPTTGANKAIGLALGIPLLYVFNVLRILVLVAVGRHQPSLFEFMHVYFWQATLILMVASVWLLWVFQVVRRRGPQVPGR